jgi:hypothetical protein
LKGSLNAEEMETLLKLNGNYKSKKGGVERMLDKLVDMVVFGAPEPCTECGTGTLNYRLIAKSIYSEVISNFI